MLSRLNSTFSSNSRKDVRYEDVTSEREHNLAAGMSKGLLLEERLEKLKSLKFELLQDDWKYQKNSDRKGL
jgi:hypothetical protein